MSTPTALRPYQRLAVEHTRAALARGERGIYFSLPTGTGKSTVLSHLTDGFGHVVALAHRIELIDQLANRFRSDWDRPVGIVRGSQNEWDAEIVVATPQTLRAHRLEPLLETEVDLLMIDEAHHVSPGSRYDVIAHEVGAPIVGCTATPFRADKKRMQDVLPVCSFSRTIDEMQAEGYLCPLTWRQIDVDVDLSSIESKAGVDGLDYRVEVLAEAMRADPVVDAVVARTAPLLGDRPAVAFAADVQHAQLLAEGYQRAGIRAATVWGAMPKEDRRAVLTAWRNGAIQLVSNCAVITEGYDFPQIAALVMARPTRSPGLFLQCLDLATEILTDQGWIGIDDAWPLGARAAGFDLETGAIRWSHVSSKTRRWLAPEEQMFSLAGPGTDIRVTGGHRMIHRTRRGRSRTRTAWSLAMAQDLSGVPDMYEMPVAGFQCAAGLPLTDDELRFIGWVLTDGTINPTTGGICISQATHQPWVDEIERVLQGCGLKYTKAVTRRRTNYSSSSEIATFTVSRGEPRGRDKHLSGWQHLEAYLDKDLSPAMEDIDRRQLGVLLEAIHQGDGAKQAGQSWVRRSYHISTANPIFADRLQSLCIRRGYRCNLSPITYNARPAFTLHVKDAAVRHFRPKAADRAVLSPEQQWKPEPVWCIETEMGTIVTRRNGKVLITGNCVGRGTRVFPGKEDCLVLDVTGKGELNDTTQVILPDVVSVTEFEDLGEENEPGARQSGLNLEKQRRFQQFRDPGKDVVYRWIRDEGRYLLPAGDNLTMVLQADPRGSGLYHLAAIRRDSRIRLSRHPDTIWEQQRLAALWLQRHAVPALSHREQAWHTRNATTRQLAFLRTLDAGAASRAEAEHWTRVQVGDEITRLLVKIHEPQLLTGLWSQAS